MIRKQNKRWLDFNSDKHRAFLFRRSLYGHVRFSLTCSLRWRMSWTNKNEDQSSMRKANLSLSLSTWNQWERKRSSVLSSTVKMKQNGKKTLFVLLSFQFTLVIRNDMRWTSLLCIAWFFFSFFVYDHLSLNLNTFNDGCCPSLRSTIRCDMTMRRNVVTFHWSNLDHRILPSIAINAKEFQGDDFSLDDEQQPIRPECRQWINDDEEEFLWIIICSFPFFQTRQCVH